PLFHATPTADISPLSLHDALPIFVMMLAEDGLLGINRYAADYLPELAAGDNARLLVHHLLTHTSGFDDDVTGELLAKRVVEPRGDRKSTRLNSSHRTISYAVFCLK